MATSDSYDFNLTREQIIQMALEQLGEWDTGETISAEDTSRANVRLNMLLKSLTRHGIDCWVRKELTLFLEEDGESYTLGPSGDHVTEEYVQEALATAGVSTDTTITVDSDAGISDGDFIGIKLDDDTFHWTTVNGAPASDVVTLTDALPGTASADQPVYVYTTKAQKPVKILSVVRRSTENLDTDLSMIGRDEYHELSDKSAEGAPTVCHYQANRSDGTLWTWPTTGPSSDTDKLVMVAQYYLQDMDADDDEADVPLEALDVIVYGLAMHLAPAYGLSNEDRYYFKNMYKEFLNQFLDSNVEQGELRLTVDSAQRWGETD